MTQQNHGAFDAQGRRKYLTGQEGLDFMDNAATLPDRKKILCETLYYVGCRPSELISLKFRDLDVTTRQIRITCLKKRGKIVIRRVPIPEGLAQAICDIGPGHEDGRLFPVSRPTVWRIVASVMKLAGISGVHACPKGLRHGFGVRSVTANIPVHLIQRWMGHANPQTTAIYLDVQDAEERRFISRTWDLGMNLDLSVGKKFCSECAQHFVDKVMQGGSRTRKNNGFRLLQGSLTRLVRNLVDKLWR